MADAFPKRFPPAVILAAGRGNRLLPLTLDRPKCLLEIGGRPILLHQIEALEGAGISRIEVVVGHGAALVEEACRDLDGGRLRFALNAHYDTTTSLDSLGCSTLDQPELGPEGMLILNSDVLFDPALISLLLSDPRPQVLLADFRDDLGEEEMKIRADGEFRIAAISKKIDPSAAQAENLGVLKVGPEAARRMLALGRDAGARSRGLLWVPDSIQELLAEIPYHALPVGDLPWTEIDYLHDLARAREEVWPRIQDEGLRREARQREALGRKEPA